MPSRAFVLSDRRVHAPHDRRGPRASQCPHGHSFFLTDQQFEPKTPRVNYVSMPSRAFVLSDVFCFRGQNGRVWVSMPSRAFVLSDQCHACGCDRPQSGKSQCPHGHSFFLTDTVRVAPTFGYESQCPHGHSFFLTGWSGVCALRSNCRVSMPSRAFVLSDAMTVLTLPDQYNAASQCPHGHSFFLTNKSRTLRRAL